MVSIARTMTRKVKSVHAANFFLTVFPISSKVRSGEMRMSRRSVWCIN